MFVDTHCHPYFKQFNADREEVIQRAREGGVEKMIIVGCDKFTNRQALALAKNYDFMHPTLGVHPTECTDLTDEEIEFIRENKNEIVAVGEMGMDFHHNKFTKEVQEECFRKQIRLANELELPCIVHSRDAADDTLRILVDEEAEKVVFHCYSYGYEFAKKVWEKGYYTSFSGVVTYDNAKAIQEAAAKGPIDLFLIETDCPFLPPASIRGKRNEMIYVKEVAEKIAELRELDLAYCSSVLKVNSFSFFQLGK